MFDANKFMETAKRGNFLNTDGIQYDLDGKGLAMYIESLGFKVVSYQDVGTHGRIILENGIEVSTNGHCLYPERPVSK